MTFRCSGRLGAVVLFSALYAGQRGSAQTQAQAPLQILNPHYVTVNESTIVNAPVDKVWARVGKFCDITEWMNSPEWEDCKYLQGDGGAGSVRSIVDEVIVGQTQYSYTYPATAKRYVIQLGPRHAGSGSFEPLDYAPDLYDAEG